MRSCSPKGCVSRMPVSVCVYVIHLEFIPHPEAGKKRENSCRLVLHSLRLD